MSTIDSKLAPFREAAKNPAAVLDKHIANGKKVVGVGPYYAPEELIYAAGAEPFGIWGMVGAAEKARKYFPPFYCSICQMTLEMGMNGMFDKQSGYMVTGLCDTLRAASQNYKVGIPHIPQIYVSLPQHRRCDAAKEYVITSFKEVAHKVEECVGNVITDASLIEANTLFNDWRHAMRDFVKLAGTHPAEVSIADRTAVINSGYYMDKKEHLELVKDLNTALAALPNSQEGFTKVMISGIYQDIPAIEQILMDNKYCIVCDDLAKESRAFARETINDSNPLWDLAMSFINLPGDSILYDPGKTHCDRSAQKAADTGAKGVILLLAKFCDPEEFDAPYTINACKALGLPTVRVEIDQSTETYEQARTQLETFVTVVNEH